MYISVHLILDFVLVHTLLSSCACRVLLFAVIFTCMDCCVIFGDLPHTYSDYGFNLTSPNKCSKIPNLSLSSVCPPGAKTYKESVSGLVLVLYFVLCTLFD